MFLYLDIETVRGTVPKPLMDSILGGVKPDARAKDKEASIYEKQEKILAEAALSPMLSQIVCVGAAVADGDPVAFVSENEKELLETLNQFLWESVKPSENTVLVTWNGWSFDVPILMHKYTRHGLMMPPFPLLGRKGDFNRHVDLRLIVTNFDQYARGTLEQYAAFYGWPEIRTETGGDIQALYDAKKFKEIAEKCKGDVERTRYIHGFYEGVIG